MEELKLYLSSCLMRVIGVIQQPVCDAAVIGQLHRQPSASHLSRRARRCVPCAITGPSGGSTHCWNPAASFSTAHLYASR
jgi:hypothetical protein